jgi:hypothetical protein
MILHAVVRQLVADKVEWDWHLENFIRQNKEHKVTIEEYCRAYELTYSTGRKKLNKKRAAAGDHLPKSTLKKGDQKRNDPPKKIPRNCKGDHPEKTNTNNRLDDGKGRKGVSKSTHLPSSSVKVIPKDGVVHTKKPRGGTRFAKGNELGLVTGIGGTPREQDVQAALEALSQGDDTYLFETILRNESHKKLVERAFSRTAARLEAEIEAMAKPKAKEKDEEQQFGPPPDMVLLKMALEVGYYFNDHQSRIAAVIQARQKLNLDKDKNQAKALADRRKLNTEDLRLEMRQQELADKQHERDRTQQAVTDALRMRENDELDDIGVAEYIEVLGLKVPAFLAARAQKALDGLEPPVSNDSTVDDDQIEREAEEYRRRRDELPQVLEERREAVIAMVEQMGQGDVDLTGERKAGEFEDDDPDLDLDPSATADIYNEEPVEIAIEPPDEGDD